MSIGKVLKLIGVSALLWLALPQSVLPQQPGCATCQPYSCGANCQWHHCPGIYHYCYEAPPCLHYKRGCPHPVCPPCSLPHWGYFETCWAPPPPMWNWAHCPTLPPAATVSLNPYINPNLPPQYAPRQAPMTPPPAVTPLPNGRGFEELPAPTPLPTRPLR